MKNIQALILSFLLPLFAKAQLAQTCIQNTTEFAGVSSSGTAFTDFGYLYANELTYLVYRLT